MSNVQAGDLARIIHPKLAGKLVSVIERAPRGDFRLPNKQLHRDAGDGVWWVCESLGQPFPTQHRRSNGEVFSRPSCFAVIEDCWLRPIRDPGEGARDETLDWLPVPARRVKEAA